MWRAIWVLSEIAGVRLGRFAPYVFSKMIGSKGLKIS